MTSREMDPDQAARFVEGHVVSVPGGGAVVEVADSTVFMAVSLRNVGTGLAVLQGWSMSPGERIERTHSPLDEFTHHVRDIFVAPGDHGFWQGAFRDPDSVRFRAVVDAVEAREPLMLDILYSDYEGGQRMITQLALRFDGERWKPLVARHFRVESADPS